MRGEKEERGGEKERDGEGGKQPDSHIFFVHKTVVDIL